MALWKKKRIEDMHVLSLATHPRPCRASWSCNLQLSPFFSSKALGTPDHSNRFTVRQMNIPLYVASDSACQGRSMEQVGITTLRWPNLSAPRTMSDHHSSMVFFDYAWGNDILKHVWTHSGLSKLGTYGEVPCTFAGSTIFSLKRFYCNRVDLPKLP